MLGGKTIYSTVHIITGGRVIGLRFAVFGHFLCGYLRFRGFWAIFLRFCGFGKTAAVLRFLAIFTCGVRYQVILLAVLRYQYILFAVLQIKLRHSFMTLCSIGVSLMIE